MVKLTIYHCEIESFSIIKTLTATLVGGSGSNSDMRFLIRSLNSYDMNCKTTKSM